MYKNSTLAKSIRMALAIGSASVTALSYSAMAADQDTNKKDDVVEKISVTGSRIKSQNFESTSPVSITTKADIKLSGFTRVEDILNSLPQIEAGQTSFLSNGATGTATLDLRGLGPERTLVLVNGRRLQPGGIYSPGSADINQIPAALIKQVDVVTGGASSTYGADAVAGVVNFVMDDDFEGFELTAGASGYQHNNDNKYIQGLMDKKNFDYPTGNSGIDGRAYNLDLTMGGDFDSGKGHAVVYATWRRNDELREAARDYSSCALNDAETSCGGSGNAVIPNFYIGDINPATGTQGDYEYWTLDQNSNFIPSTGNQYNYAPVNHFMRPDERYSMGGFVHYDVNDYVRPYMEVSYMHDRTAAQIAESGTFFAQEYDLNVNTSLLNDAQRQQLMDRFGLGLNDKFSVYIGKRNVEGGPRASLLEHNSFRIVVGSKGDLNDTWSYDTSLQIGRTTSSNAYINDFFGPRIATALDPVKCADTSGCVPYNVFQYNGITPAAAATLTGTGILSGVTTEKVLTGYVTGDTSLVLPSAMDPVSLVFGAEYRKEEFERTADEVFQQGLLLGQGGPTLGVSGYYSVKEVFSEANVPLVQGKEGIEDLSLNLGYRYSDYNTFGGVSTYKVGMAYQPISSVKVRASYNRAVRAPNVFDLYASSSLGLWQGQDPCAGSSPELTQEQCANTGMTADQYGTVLANSASQYNGHFGGNPDLQPEEADSYTFGVVVNPSSDLSLSVDWFDIKIDKNIGAIGGGVIVKQCAITGDPFFCDNVHRSNAGSLWRGNSGYVVDTTRNLGKRHWQGVDLSGSYRKDVGPGTMTVKMTGSYMITKEYAPVPTDTSQNYSCINSLENACYAQPKWRHTMTVGYTTGDFWTVDAKWRYYGSVGYNGSVDTRLADAGGISSQSYLDLKATFVITDNISTLIGVNNVLDKEPPMVGGALSTNANAVAGFYDTLGRYLHASVTLKF